MWKWNMTTPFETTDADLLEALADGVRPVELSAAQRESMRSRIQRRVTSEAPLKTRTIRSGEGDWVKVNELVMVKTLRLDREANSQTVMIRMLPGGVVVGHRHSQEEECLVVEGEIEIGEHRLFQGDMHIAAPGSVHVPITTRTGALLMIRSEIPPATFRIA
jgi:quercetin dioxygenase-like cupin family protein